MLKYLLTSFIFLAVHQSHALIEARGTVGFGLIHSTHLNRVLSSNGIPEIYAIGQYGLDGLIEIPATSIVVGARYDWQGIRVGDDNSNNITVACSRVAILLGYRIINTGGVRVGPILSYGVKHTPNISLKIANTTTEYDEGNAQSVSGGVEAGIALGPVLLGVEGGFQSYLVTDIKKGATNAGFDLNLGAVYARGFAGLTF